MHTKCSTCDVACQKIFQGTEKHQGYQWMSCFTLPSKGVHLWKRVMQAERYKHHFFQFATFFHIGETPFVTCFCTKQNHVPQILYEVKEKNGDIFVWEWKWLTGHCEGKRKWSSCLASWCVDPWFKCALLIPLVTLS